MKHVIHLMPYDGIGGVELAAKSTAGYEHPSINLELAYIFPQVTSRAQRKTTFNPLHFVTAARRIISAKPDLLLVSLWRSCIVGLLVKLFCPRIRLVTFIHNSKDAHIIDRVLNRLSVKLSIAVFFDSESSRQERLALPADKHNAIISFLIRRIEPLEHNEIQPTPRFIFWGRLNPQKNLTEALALFAGVHQARTESHFDIIGPDGGEAAALQTQVEALGLNDAVTFHGPLNWQAIRKLAESASFYLQTSHYEGMSIAVTEAMQLGLVPIVTPVGEIATYCYSSNALILRDKTQIPAYKNEIAQLIADPDQYRKKRNSAINHWRDHPLYCEALFDQLSVLLPDHSSSQSDQLSEH